MTRQKLSKWICPTAWAFCLAVGYLSIGQWVLLALVCLAWLAWLFAAPRSPSIVLAASVGLSAAGVGAGASPSLMIIGATLAIASWDLVRWEAFVAGGLPADTAAWLERKHYAGLALALGPGLLAAVAGRLVRFSIPFWGLMGLAALALLALDRVWNLVKD